MRSDVNSFLDEFIKKSLGNQYVIPVYQRNYTWNRKHVKQLLNDVKDLLLEKKEYHFLGTIVYSIKNEKDITEREIVDGQQRLTTMFLMLYALKSISVEIGNIAYAGRLTEEYLENKFVDDKYKLRLKPLVSDDNVYQLIADGNITEIQKNEKINNSKVYINYECIKEEFEKWVINEKHDVMSIIRAIDKLKIVYIQIDQSDDAQSIFESINSTGETLTSADLIRNYVLMNKTNDIQEKYYREYWLKLEKYMSEDSKRIAEFLRFYLACKTYNLCNQNSIYDTFKSYWETCKINEENSLKELVRYAHYYYILYFCHVDDIPYCSQAVIDLRRIKSNMPAPFIMEMMNLQEEMIISEESLRQIIEMINIYMIRRHMMKLDTSDITRLFPQLLRKVLSLCKQYSFMEIVDIFKKCLINDNRQKSSFMPDDNQLLEYLNRANSYTLSHTRFILDKIEHLNNTAPVDLSNLSIEHIMPQTPNEYWIKYTEGNRQEYDIQVNRLGNLTLVSKPDNSEAGNKSFETKRRVMDDTKHIKLNADILMNDKTGEKREEWTTKDIDERTAKLIQKFLIVFPYLSTDKEYFDKENEKRIHIDRDGIHAEAIYKSANEIEVLAGSEINLDIIPNSDKNKQIRNSLIEDSIVIQNTEGEWVFETNYLFSSLSESANVILGGKHNGYNCWKDDSEMTLQRKNGHAEDIENDEEE